MSELNILSKDERRAFDKTPTLSKEERQLYFRLDRKLKATVAKLGSPINKLGFVLQLGYFKAMARFYPTSEFKKRDVNHVKRMLGIKDELPDFKEYNSTTYYRHQEKIQALLSWHPFDAEAQSFLREQAHHQAGLQRKPKRILWHLIDTCWKYQYTIPTYTELAEIVTEGFLDFEKIILARLTAHLSETLITQLDQVIEYNGRDRHPITCLRPINQSLKPRDLAESAAIARNVGEYYLSCSPVMQNLSLSSAAVEYYATWVQKARTGQITGFADRRKIYLHLLAYFEYQYFSRQDALTTAFSKCVYQSLSKSRKRLNNHEIDSRNSRNNAIRNVVKNSRSLRELMNDIRQVSKLSRVTPSEKYYKIESLIKEFDKSRDEDDSKLLEALENQLIKESNDDKLFEIMASISKALQLRASPILKVLQFNEDESDPVLMEAIEYFQKHDGKIADTAPTAFLKPKELEIVTKEDEFNVPLYKFLLFVHVADGIRSGDLNLKYSYRYKAISDYLIDKREWLKNREQFLRAAGLEKYQNIEEVLEELKQILDNKYHEINKSFAAGLNPYLSLNEADKISIKTPKTEYDTSGFNAEALEQSGIVSIQQVMSDVNSACDFASAFSHMSVKNSKLKLKFNTIAAGIIGLGCNIGLSKLANISVGVGENTLRNTVNWCFNLRTVSEANQIIAKSINELVLAKSYLKNAKRLHSSSDGRKVGVGVDSLLASRSFKYFGKDQGVVIYTFIDERQVLYYSTVISASDREAPYVIDGLMQNNEPHEIIHSTDEHGFSEAVHAATHLIDTTFAPRFKSIGRKTIYGFSTKKTYRKMGYRITPSRTINQTLIRNNWDDILRFMATIKLNHATASQLFKRLSSYAKENPLYKALKEFGRIIKSIYVLTYCNDVELRQAVQKNLSRIELSNKFSHAVFFDNDQEFQVGDPNDQELATACKTLIQNAIVFWNYLALSELIVKTEDADAREELIDSIHRGTVLCWRHINLRGTYDFRKQAVHGSRFNLNEIKQLRIG